MTQKAHMGFIAIILLITLLSACGYDESVSTATPKGTTVPEGTTVPGSTMSSLPGSVVDTPVATTGCGKISPVAPGTSANATLTSGGLQRTYRLHVPTSYNPQQMLPLVLNIPGHAETALQQERSSQYSVLADQSHFLIVYPQGSIGLDGKLAWATYGKNDPTVNDVLFFSDLLNTLQQHLCVDAHRIYVIGISNGGAMSNVLACRMAGRITAFAAVAAAIHPIPGGCHPSRAVPYLEFHGTRDPLVPYDGSSMLRFAPVMQTMQSWATLDSCTSGPSIFFRHADITGFTWTGCRNGVTVQHYRIAGGGHTWPGSPIPSSLGLTTHVISATALSWQFFQNYSLMA